jgi:hypothetical protein
MVLHRDIFNFVMFVFMFVVLLIPQCICSSFDDVNFDDMTRNEIIGYYFDKGYSHKEIVSVLATVHAITLSCRTIRRILKALGRARHQPPSRQTLATAVQFTQQQLQESGQFLGYRALWKRLQSNKIHLSQKKTLQMFRLMDGEGVAQRKRKCIRRRDYINPGPNFVWHIDGYDKLKPYGFPIHGAIDGFSRRILWLEVGCTNNNPIVVAKFFCKAAIENSMLPCVVRADRGTENVHVQKIQVYFRTEHDDYLAGDSSFQYGKSTGNQRIEAFWGQLRRQCVQFWMNKFKDLATLGSFDMTSKIETYTLRFCYINIIRKELTRIAHEWNSHSISGRANVETKGGKPDVLYFAPSRYGAAQFGKSFDFGDMHVITDRLENIQDFDDFPADFIVLLREILPNVQPPTQVAEADQLFAEIIAKYRNVRLDLGLN